MKTFRDNTGKEWIIQMTIDSVKRCRDLLDVNLLEPEKGDPPLLTQIGTDEILLCDIIFCLVKPQADKDGITDSQFGQSLGGKAILDAQNAFYDELIDFFQNRGRIDRVKAVQKQLKMIQLAVEHVSHQIDSLDCESEVQKVFGSLSTKRLEPSVSIQAD